MQYSLQRAFFPERAVYSTLFYSLTCGFKEKRVYFTAFYEARAAFCCRRHQCTNVMRVSPLSSAHKQGLFLSINMLTTGPRLPPPTHTHTASSWGLSNAEVISLFKNSPVMSTWFVLQYDFHFLSDTWFYGGHLFVEVNIHTVKKTNHC